MPTSPISCLQTEPDALGFRLSCTIEDTISPPIPQAYKWASDFVPNDGRQLIDFAQGVPHYSPHLELRKALADASSDARHHGYAPMHGEPALRTAVADILMPTAYEPESTRRGAESRLDVKKDDICVTAGCNLAFVATIMSVAGPGDEVILPTPWYFNHRMTMAMLGITTVPFPTYLKHGDIYEDAPDRFTPHFKHITLLASLVTSRTRAIVIVTPNNPSGAVYPASLIARIAVLARAKKVALIIDETYRDFITTPAHQLFLPTPPPSSRHQHDTHPTAFEPSKPWDWRKTVIHLFSFSKSYGIPGSRVGLVCASPLFLASLTKALDTLQVSAPRAPQIALASCINQPAVFQQLRQEFITHRDALATLRNDFKNMLPPGWILGSAGGFYAMVRHPWKGINGVHVAMRMARDGGIVTLPIEFFTELAGKIDETDWRMVDIPSTANAVVTKFMGDGNEWIKERDERPLDSGWLRFSLANVDRAIVEEACHRLQQLMDVDFEDWRDRLPSQINLRDESVSATPDNRVVGGLNPIPDDLPLGGQAPKPDVQYRPRPLDRLSPYKP